ncbi:MAG: gamma-glutamyl-gamma-aminobutyrate hydrolase family protein [Fimbriimonadaceae bacterium]
MKPIVGITVECKFDPEDARSRGNMSLNWNYAEQIALAGGVPIVIPPTADPEALVPILDGWLIPGGNDIDARHWGEPNHPKSELQDPSRFEIEAALFRLSSPEMPILGICYGCQFLNVARGGSLIQHLPDVVPGEHHSGGTLDRAVVETDSKLGSIVGAEVTGRSYHHQAVGRVGDGLTVVARHADGTVEAIEATDRPWLIGVQWHPERTPDDAATQNLFREFVAAAARYRAAKSARLLGVGGVGGC